MEQKITAIVLKAVNYKEKDRILTVLSAESGKLSLLMRGVRGASAKLKFASGAFSFVEYVVTRSGDMWLVTGASEIESFFAVSQDPEKYKYASAILELTDKVSIAGESNTALFLTLVKALKALAFTAVEADVVFLKFCVDLFNLSGYRISSSKCSSCGAEIVGKTYFLLDQGCLTCSLCKNIYAIEVSAGAASTLRILSNTDIARLENIHVQNVFRAEVEALFIRNITERFNCKLKSLNFF